jgi:hypothetical protein
VALKVLLEEHRSWLDLKAGEYDFPSPISPLAWWRSFSKVSDDSTDHDHRRLDALGHRARNGAGA